MFHRNHRVLEHLGLNRVRKIYRLIIISGSYVSKVRINNEKSGENYFFSCSARRSAQTNYFSGPEGWLNFLRICLGRKGATTTTSRYRPYRFYFVLAFCSLLFFSSERFFPKQNTSSFERHTHTRAHTNIHTPTLHSTQVHTFSHAYNRNLLDPSNKWSRTNKKQRANAQQKHRWNHFHPTLAKCEWHQARHTHKLTKRDRKRSTTKKACQPKREKADTFKIYAGQ